jgi:hypothetical protein
MLNLPILKNKNATKYGFSTKLIPIFVDNVQTGWEEVHINSQLFEVRRDSDLALRNAGLKVPFVDYDPIGDYHD